jgi:hypothetical protein
MSIRNKFRTTAGSVLLLLTTLFLLLDRLHVISRNFALGAILFGIIPLCVIGLVAERRRNI